MVKWRKGYEQDIYCEFKKWREILFPRVCKIWLYNAFDETKFCPQNNLKIRFCLQFLIIIINTPNKWLLRTMLHWDNNNKNNYIN